MAKRARGWLVARLTAAVLLCALLPARRADAAASVALSIAPDVPASLSGRLQSAIAGQLADLPPEPSCELRVSRADDALRLSFRDAAGQARGERIVRAQSEELVASEAASIVRAFVVALTEEPTLAVPASAAQPVENAPPTPAPPRSIVPAVAPPPPARARAAPREWLWLSAYYTGSTYAQQLRWQSGVRAEASLRIFGRLRAGLSYGYHPPATVKSELATFRIADHNVSALVGVYSLPQRVMFGGEILFGATHTLRNTTGVVDPVVAVGSSARWSALVTLRARARLHVMGRLWLELAPALEIPLGLADAEVVGVADPVVLSPRKLRARVDLGASFELP